MSWLDAVPVGLLSAVWLFVPGLLVTYGYGLRGFAAWGLAPVVSVAVAATTAVVAQKIGVPWSVPLVVVVAVAIAVVVSVVAFLLRRRWPALPADPRRVTLAAALGMVPAVLLGFITFVHGVQSPTALSQTYDAVLHYNTVRSIVDTKDASSLVLGTVGIPGESNIFYPGGWHDIVSLVVMSGGFGIPASVNMVSLVIGIVVWPVSCMALVRQVVGRSAVALAVTGVLSIAFTAFPWDLLSFGVLWPNLLGMALVPAVLAAVLSVTGLAREDAVGRGRAWLMLPVALVGTGFAHPNAVFTVLTLSVVPVLIGVGRRLPRLRANGRLGRGVAEFGGTVVVVVAFWYWADTTPVFASVRDFYWAPFDTQARAVGEVLFASTTGYRALWLMALLVLGGLLLFRRIVEIRWLVAGFVITGFLYVLSASENDSFSQQFTGFWYNDPHRLAAMLPVTAVPLAVVAVVWLGRQGAALLERRPQLVTALRGRAFAAATLVVVVLLGVLTGGLYAGKHAMVIQTVYVRPRSDPSLQFVSPAAESFFAQVRQHTPPDAVVANNPWDGSALLWALADRRVLFPHMGVQTTADLRYLAAHLDDAAADPKVCQAANRTHVGYLIVGDGTFWPWDKRADRYPGLKDPGNGGGFRLVLSSGPKLKLYQITACGTQQ